MAIGKKISALTAAAMLTATAAAFPATVASAATYDDTSYASGSLTAGDVVQIDTLAELCCFADYVNSGGTTAGITFELTGDIKASNYSYNFDKNSGCVLAYNTDNEVAFCIGTGIQGTVTNTSTASTNGVIYTADAANGTLTATAAPADAVSSFTTIASSSYPFNGTFDGNGYTISGLYNLTSLFGYLTEAEVYDLTIADSYIYNASGDAAGLAMQSKGTIVSYVTVQDTYVSSANGNAAGIVAYVESRSGDSASALIACQNIGSGAVVNSSGSSNYTGGIVANTRNRNGEQFRIYSCYNACNIYANSTCASGVIANLSFGFFNTASLSVGTIYGGSEPSVTGTYENVYQIPSDKETTVTDGLTFITAEQVASGEIAYIMESIRKNSDVETSVYWTQNLSVDGSVPALSASDEYLVCCAGDSFANGTVDVHSGSDSSSAHVSNGNNTHSYNCSNCGTAVSEECTFENGICIYCDGDEAPPIVNNYYQISNYAQLCWFANAVNSNTALTHNVQITEDITADSGAEWAPIGTAAVPYSGVFDGQRHIISGLNVSEGTYVGLFGYVSEAYISYIGVEDSSFSGTNYVGALAGSVANSTILFSYAYNNVIDCSNTCGGFVATAQGATIRFSYTDSDKGFAGNGNPSVFGCYHTGSGTIGTSVSFEQISSGELAYIMNQDSIYASYPIEWGQNLISDSSHPILDTDYEVFCSGEGYDNSAPSEHAPEDIVCNSDGTHTFDCTYCGYNLTEKCSYVDGFCSVCEYFDNDAETIVYQIEGTCILPTPRTSASNQVVGWMSSDGALYPCGTEVAVSDGTSFTRITLNLSTIGASARLNSDSTGIRFATQFDIIGSDYDTLDISVGTLICPTDYVTSDSIFNYEEFVTKGYIALIYEDDASVFNEITVNGSEYDNAYFGSIININAYNYAREFTGCGFAKVVYADNSVGYFYATAKSSQSIYSLAAKAYGDRTETEDNDYTNPTDTSSGTYYSRYTDDELAILEGFIDGVVNFNIDLANKGSAALVVPEEIANYYEVPYTIAADYQNNVITVSAIDDAWKSFIAVQKSSGEVLYQRISIMINGKRVSYANDQDNFEIPNSTGDADSAVSTLDIKIVGLE